MMLSKKQKRLIDKFEMDAVWALCETRYQLSLYIFMTMQCNLACKDCFVGCSPNRPKDFTPCADIEYYVKHFQEIGDFNNSILFTGGEPTLNMGVLSQSLNLAMQNKMLIGLKTNGLWALDQKKSDAVYSMFSDLFDQNKPYRDENGDASVHVDISVDNVLHPTISADAFKSIAQRVSGDKKLAENIELRAMGFADSKEWFNQTVINDPAMNFSVQKKLSYGTEMNLNGKQINAYMFGRLSKPSPIQSSRELLTVVKNYSAGVNMRLPLRFYPDKTVGLATAGLKSCARIPYLHQDGGFKSWVEIRDDMIKKMVAEYTQLIQNER